MKKTLKTILFILAACVLAIASKMLLPSEVNAEDFNSLLVLKFGFPIVATSYFVMIYTHNAVVTKWFSKNEKLSNLSCGLRTGISFGLIYLLGMEEVVVEASPFAEWGFPFVKYQFVMGIGEAVMALLLCLCIALFVVDKKDGASCEKINSADFRAVFKKRFWAVVFIASGFFVERVILYNTGLISSDVKTYPVPTYIWTLIFGITFGICFCLIYPMVENENRWWMSCFKTSVLAIGLCWIGFNLFIAFIYKDSLSDILIRSLTDTAVLFGTSVLWCTISKKV